MHIDGGWLPEGTTNPGNAQVKSILASIHTSSNPYFIYLISPSSRLGSCFRRCFDQRLQPAQHLIQPSEKILEFEVHMGTWGSKIISLSK